MTILFLIGFTVFFTFSSFTMFMVDKPGLGFTTGIISVISLIQASLVYCNADHKLIKAIWIVFAILNFFTYIQFQFTEDKD